MLNLLKQSQQLAAKTQDEFEMKKTVIEVQEPSVIASKELPSNEPKLESDNGENGEVAIAVANVEVVAAEADAGIIKDEIPAKNEIDELSKEIALETRHEPMTLQPQERIIYLFVCLT